MSLSKELKRRAQDLTVLYVEDEDSTRNQISQILKLFFKEVVVCENGFEALQSYKQNSTDLVITDLTMPKMSGLEMVKKIKEFNHNQHAIILTAHNSSENLMQT
ncbi:MAG: response regulator, partial [Campylobacterota bacterium]|nr:response regulator [Campylobacterota bacterium]